MKRILLSAAFGVLLLSILSIPAMATAVANFEGSSLVFSRNADFDALRGTGSSCSSGTPSYSWTFDDGGTATGNPVTHKWSSSTSAGTAKLTVTCSGGGGTASLTRAVCFSVGVPGCILPDSGYN